MRPILDVARDLGLSTDAVEPYGRYMAKVPLESFPSQRQDTPLVVVTAITPTPAGEGKTTTAIGLSDGLARLGKRPVLTIRQPSMSLLFGQKGGGTGGGKARVVPEAEINLNFTGDSHAIASAHNLLAAMTDAAVYYRAVPGLAASGLEWRRVVNTQDRALRHVVTGLGGRGNGPMRETGFDVDAASEIMAVLALATGYDDLRARLGRMVVGFTSPEGKPVTAADVGAVGPMMAILKDALKPNLVQTLEGTPALVHTGPFGNIAHGCSSVLADRLGLACGDILVTEAGFGADLGLEKFMHIKARSSGLRPSVAVVVATLRALKYQGGVPLKDVESPNAEALAQGIPSLEHALEIVRAFGLPAVVAVNRFPQDAPQELAMVRQAALRAGALAVADSFAFAQGGEGARELAQAVLDVLQPVPMGREQPAQPRFLYPLEASIPEKVEAIAKQVYLAGDVQWDDDALEQAERYAKLGWGTLPVCMAKTPFSLTADSSVKGVPRGHAFRITGVRISAGAGFVYPMAGEIQTMPGLPRRPNALLFDLDAQGNVVGL